MVVGFSPLAVDATLSNACKIWEETCFAQLQGNGCWTLVQKIETGLWMLE